MTLKLIHDAFQQALHDVQVGAGDLHTHRDHVDLQVRGFLEAGWTGPAAESFSAAWDDWTAGASDVLDGLVAMGQLLDAAYADYVAQDEASQARLDRVAAKLVERLG
jgi:WXG100 family type VII secretion target